LKPAKPEMPENVKSRNLENWKFRKIGNLGFFRLSWRFNKLCPNPEIWKIGNLGKLEI